MSDEDFEDSPDLELEDELIEGDEPLDDDLAVEVDGGEDADDLDLLDDDALDLSPEVPVAVVTDDTATETVDDEEDDGVVDLEEELHPDDVEEPLDVLLQERTAVAALDDDEEDLEEEDSDADDRVDGPARIVPRRPDEFLCQSCFLLLPLRRLADKDRQFCDDCA